MTWQSLTDWGRRVNLPNVVALVVLLVGIPLNVAVTFLLYQAYRDRPHNRVLRERFIAELSVLLLIVVFVIIFLNNDSLVPLVTTETSKLITRLAMLAVAVIPASYWLYLYRKG